MAEQEMRIINPHLVTQEAQPNFLGLGIDVPEQMMLIFDYEVIEDNQVVWRGNQVTENLSASEAELKAIAKRSFEWLERESKAEWADETGYYPS